ncbi:MAG TPA: glycosyltransferase family 4 protein [Candidatus Brocadiia bacterium]|nr:glycosyltransferase family 4 protein [Candidatus Brocadiia bacterium]
MKVLLLNQFYPPDTAATGQLLADVASHLASLGHDVHVLCSAGQYAGGVVADAGGEPGVTVHRVGATSRGRATSFDQLCDWASFHALTHLRITRLGRFDACLALTTPPFIALAALRLQRMWKTRVVLWSMDVWPEIAEVVGILRPGSLPSRVLRGVARHIYRRADAIISLGPRMSERLVEAGAPAGRVTVVHNWAPGESVTPQPFPDGVFTVMYSGNMGPGHDMDTILSAARLLRDNPSVQFLFAAHGKRRAALEAQARQEGLTNIRWTDPCPLSGLSRSLGQAHAHLACLSPEAEGLMVPSKVYGILAAGRPALMAGSTQGDLSILLRQSGGGLSAGHGQARELAGVILRLQADPDQARRMGAAGRSYYEQHLCQRRGAAAVAAVLTGQQTQGHTAP